MSARTPNPEQRRAIEASGVVFVSAGAGTGKTTVLVERFCRAVVERGLPVDSLLVITYTDRAAGELRSRIRSSLHERDRHDLARELDGAWISTIHGFCSRLLRQNSVAAGVDPHFRVLDAEQALLLARGGIGLPSQLDSNLDSRRVGAWLIDRYRVATWLTIEPGLRLVHLLLDGQEPLGITLYPIPV